MARYTGPKHKLARREGVNILDKISPSLEKRLKVPPGVHGHKRTRKLGEYGMELREKQKLKRIYGILEKQFLRYIKASQKKKGGRGLPAGTVLLQMLETRLDNILYRLRLAATRPHARQLVVHGHVSINSKKVDRPSYSVRPGEVITLQDKLLETPVVKKLLSDGKVETPSFLKRKGPAGQLVRVPTREEITVPIDERLIIEYYSR